MSDAPHIDHASVLRFGIFEADLDTRELRRKERPIRLPPKQFELLAILLERRGELVPFQELEAKLWPKGHVDTSASLGEAIFRLRKALNDTARAPRYIETVRGTGYRFVAAVIPEAQCPGTSSQSVLPLNHLGFETDYGCIIAKVSSGVMFRPMSDGGTAAVILAEPLHNADLYDGLYLGLSAGTESLQARPVDIEVTFSGHTVSNNSRSVQLLAPVSGRSSIHVGAPDCVTVPFSDLAPVTGSLPFPRVPEKAGVLVVRLTAVGMELGDWVTISGLGLTARGFLP